MSEEFTVVLDAVFAEKVGEDGLKEYARTVASVAEWAPGHPADEVMRALTQGWSAVDLNVDPVEGQKLADFIADPDHGDFTVQTDEGAVLYRHSEAASAKEPSGDAEVSAQSVEPAEGPSIS